MAANVIELVIAAKDQASAEIQRVESSLGGLNQVLGAFSPGLAITGFASLGAAAAGAVLSVKSLADQSQELLNVSEKTGVSVENIQAVQFEFQRLGIAPEVAGMALKFLSRAISENNPLLKEVGVTSHDVYTAWLQLADSFSTHADDANKVAVALSLLKRSGNEAIPALDQGAQAFLNEMDAARQHNAVLSDETVRAGALAKGSFDDLKLSVTGLRNELAIGLLPIVTNTTAELVGLDEAAHRLPATLAALSTAIPALFRIGMGVSAGAPSLFSAHSPWAPPSTAVLEDWPELVVSRPSFAAPKTAKTADETAREKSIEYIRQIMGYTNADAAALLDRLDAATGRADELKKIQEKLTFGPPVPPEFDDKEQHKQDEARKKMDENANAFRLYVAQLPTGRRAVEEFSESIRQMGLAFNVTTDLLNAEFNALSGGIDRALQGVLNGTRSFGADMANIFKSMVSAILSELAKLAAAQVFQILLNFALPGLGFLGGGITGLSGGGPVPGIPFGPPAPGGRVNININALSPASVLGEMLDPSGSFRRSNLRLAQLAAV